MHLLSKTYYNIIWSHGHVDPVDDFADLCIYTSMAFISTTIFPANDTL